MPRRRKSDALEVKTASGGSYPVVFAENMFGDGATAAAEVLRAAAGTESPRMFLVADYNVVQRTEGFGSAIGRYVQANGIRLAGTPVVLSGGEKVKSDDFQSVRRVACAAMDAKIGRNDVLVAIGGGSVLDVAGYVAAQTRGGVKLVRVPTTPAAMADAAFASYAAVDCGEIKDALRVASEPSAVVVDISYARTVLDGVWRGGLGEIVRFAAASDAELLEKISKNVASLKSREMDVFSEIMRDCIVSRVAKGDGGMSQWAAHRLESMSSYKLPHGYAIPIAVCIDCACAEAKGILSKEDADLIRGLLYGCGALDGLVHSRHLIAQADNILYGLDSWRLATGSDEIVLPAGLGAVQNSGPVDREKFKTAIKEFFAVPSAAAE